MKIPKISGVLLVLAIAVGCGGSPASTTTQTTKTQQLTGGKKVVNRTVTVGIGGAKTLSYLTYYLAVGLGYYDEIKKELGVDITFQEYADGTQGLSALVAGQSDISFQQAAETVTGRARAQDVVTVGSLYNSGVVVLMARKGAGINRPADLAGKKVGVTAIGAGSYVQAVAIVNAYKVKSDAVTYVPLGSTAGYIPALTSGRVDVVAAGEPFASKIQTDGTGIPISDLYDPKEVQKVFPGGFISSSLATSQKFIDEDPGFVQAFLYETVRAQRWLVAHASHPEQVTAILPKDFASYGDALPNFYKRVAPSVSQDAVAQTSAMGQVVKTQVVAKAIPNESAVDLTKFINNNFAKDADKALK